MADLPELAHRRRTDLLRRRRRTVQLGEGLLQFLEAAEKPVIGGVGYSGLRLHVVEVVVVLDSLAEGLDLLPDFLEGHLFDVFERGGGMGFIVFHKNHLNRSSPNQEFLQVRESSRVKHVFRP